MYLKVALIDHRSESRVCATHVTPRVRVGSRALSVRPENQPRKPDTATSHHVCIGPLGPGSNAVRVLRDNYKRTLHAFRVGKEQPHLSRRVRTSHTTSSPHEPRRRRMPWQRPTAHHGRPALPAHKPEGRAFSYEERHTMADTAKPKSGSARSSGSKRRSRKDTSHDLSKENK